MEEPRLERSVSGLLDAYEAVQNQGSRRRSHLALSSPGSMPASDGARRRFAPRARAAQPTDA